MPRNSRRIAILGQKHAVIRALHEFVHLARLHSMEALVLTPNNACTDVQGTCHALGLQLVVCDNDAAVLAELKRFEPHLIVSVLWPRRIQDDVLGLCADCINLHPSLLPRHRGSMTQFWAIFDGDAEAGVTCHRMVWEFDAGRILRQIAFPMAADETALSLSVKIAGAVAECFGLVLRDFLQPSGLPEGESWDVKAFPYHYRRLPKNGIIDPDWPDDKIERYIRAVYFPPHPPAKVYDAYGVEHSVRSISEYRALNISAVSPARQVAPTEQQQQRQQHPTHSWLRQLVPAAFGVVAAWALRSIFQRGRQEGLHMHEGRHGEAYDPNVAIRYGLDSYRHAKCLDGSPASYYHARATNGDGASKWLLYMQGGGWCTEARELSHLDGYSHAENVGHPDLCSSRAQGYHGSSRWDHPSRNLSGRGFLSGNPSENPLHAWHRVIVRNCDGTLFLSSSTGSNSNNNKHGVHFNGRDIVWATVDDLISRHGLDSATELLIAGCSAGGVAAVLLADKLRMHLETRVKTSVFVAVLSDSGVFPEQQQQQQQRQQHQQHPDLLEFPQFKWIYENTHVSGSLPSGCLQAGLGWRCLHVGLALPHVQTPVFLLQSLIDSWHVASLEDNKTLPALVTRISETVLPAIRPPHGGVLDACFHHCGQWPQIRFGGQSNAAAFMRWYESRLGCWLRTRSEKDSEDNSCTRDSMAAEGWPLVHGAAPWVDGCYDGQLRHRDWHRQLERLGSNTR